MRDAMPRSPAPGRTGDLFAPDRPDTPMDASTICAEVAVPVPIDKAFTYLVPDALRARITPGSRVLVPFAGRRVMGVVLTTRARTDGDR